MSQYRWHRSKGLRGKQVVEQAAACPFFPMDKGWIGVGLREVDERGKAVGPTMSTEVCARALDILITAHGHKVSTPDTGGRLWMMII